MSSPSADRSEKEPNMERVFFFFFCMINLFNSTFLDAVLRICMSEYTLLKQPIQAALAQ